MAAKKSFAAYMNPFSTGSVSQWTEKAVPAECILVQSIRQSVVAHENLEIASRQDCDPHRQTRSFGRNTVGFSCPFQEMIRLRV